MHYATGLSVYQAGGGWRVLLASLVISTMVSGRAWGDEHVWQPTGAADWFGTANWSPSGPPVAGDIASVRNGGTAQITSGAAAASELRLGYTTAAGNGTLEISGGSLSLSSLANLGSAMTGTVVVSGGAVVTIPTLQMGWVGIGIFTQNGGVVNVTTGFELPRGPTTGIYTLNEGTLNSRNLVIGSKRNGAVGVFRQYGGSSTFTNDSYVGGYVDGTTPLVTTGTVEVSGGTCVFSNAALRIGVTTGSVGTIRLSGDGAMRIYQLYMGWQGKASVIQSGGDMLIENRLQLPRGAGQADYLLSGGALTCKGASGGCAWLGTETSSGNGNFVQTGGTAVFSNEVYIGHWANSTGTVEVSGGSFAMKNLSYPGYGAGAQGIFRVRGSGATSVQVVGPKSGSGAAHTQFILDKGAAHITPVYGTASAYDRFGALSVGLEGGVLLSATNRYQLLSSEEFNSGTNYIRFPTPLWTTALDLNVDGTRDAIRVTLDATQKAADLSLGAPRSATFAPSACGYVTVANVDTNALQQGFAAWLDVDAATYGKTPQDLVNDLVAAGYTNSCLATEAPYDIVAVIPKADVANGNLYFAWDFRDVTTSATNATVSAMKITTWPPPPRGTMIRFL